ncbi:hypothetical protein ALC56_08698 [Trachymyrmex septentrionalis]|uniref:Uncharacterized protein n=1 Tax=Trachymyrmex septentrionalis TaxID=34720 RepID=A0A195F9L8_9HYME|nr:hypothetical protein ALC56_08698 [Trachymyrmex septentrionalis]
MELLGPRDSRKPTFPFTSLADKATRSNGQCCSSSKRLMSRDYAHPRAFHSYCRSLIFCSRYCVILCRTIHVNYSPPSATFDLLVKRRKYVPQSSHCYVSSYYLRVFEALREEASFPGAIHYGENYR